MFYLKFVLNENIHVIRALWNNVVCFQGDNFFFFMKSNKCVWVIFARAVLLLVTTLPPLKVKNER